MRRAPFWNTLNFRATFALVVGLASFAGAHRAVNQQANVPADFLSDQIHDPVSKLRAAMKAGTVELKYEPKHGYLDSILKQLEISPTTQVLVFSKTSLQSAYITPQNPRAVYFSSGTYVGWIPGAPHIELMSIDPQFGPVFYTLDNVPGAKPEIARQTDTCFQCHFSPVEGHVPSLMARSVFTGTDGVPQLAHGSFTTTSTSPMTERWGGWYVSGRHGSQRHMGNEVARGDGPDPINREKGANVTDLSCYFDVEPYLTPHSDIVSLMVLEQQMELQNLTTKAGFLTRRAIKDANDLISWKFEAAYVAKETQERVEHACEPLVRALVGVDEPSLTAPIEGTSGFTAYFAATAPPDKAGRRLSDLDLKTRLLRYPCSPFVYSSAFSGLPPEAKHQIFKRLMEILTGKDPAKTPIRVNPDDGKSALEILNDTLPQFSKQ